MRLSGLAGLEPADSAARRGAARRGRYRAGLLAEMVSLVLLLIKGYRILAWRHKNRAGELDLIAAKGNAIAFVEVKLRQDRETAAAAITSRQSQRARRAANLWLASRQRYRAFDLRFDAVLVCPGCWPCHIIDGA